MSRTTTGPFDSASVAEHIEGCHLCELGFDSGTVYVTDTGHDVLWNGNTYIGLGAAGGLEVFKETSTREIISVTFWLGGPVSAYRTLALTENCNGRYALVYVALWSNGVVINSPCLEFKGRLGPLAITDRPTQDGNIESIVSVTAESVATGSRRPKNSRHSVADHTLDHPGDTIHRLIPVMVNKVIAWPKASYWQR